MKRALLLASILAAAQPGWAKKRPDWIDGQSSQYSRGQYLTGVGRADDRQTAEDRARGEISKIFSTQVTVKGQDYMAEQQSSAGGKTQNDFQQSVSNEVQTLSKKTLEDVNIVDNWQDDSTREVFALAALDRQKALSKVDDKIADFDKQALQWKEQLEQSTEKLPRVKAGLKILDVLKARKDVCDDRRVLDPGGKAPESAVDESKIRPLVSKAVSELDVVVAMTGDDAPQIKTGLIKGLNDFGLQAKSRSSDAPADIVVDSSVDVSQQDLPDGKWRRAHGTVTVSLKDGKTSKVFTQFDLTDRQDSGDYKVALKRLRESLAKMTAAQVNQAITSYFENQ